MPEFLDIFMLNQQRKYYEKTLFCAPVYSCGNCVRKYIYRSLEMHHNNYMFLRD